MRKVAKISFFDVGHFFKVFIGFVIVLFLFYVSFFSATRHMGTWLPDQEIIPHRLPWKAKPQPLDHQGSPTKDF